MPAQVFHVPGLFLVRIHAIAGVASDEDALPLYHRARGAGARQFDLPDNVLLRRPLDRQPFFFADAQATGPAELPPIGGPESANRRRQVNQANASVEMSHGMPRGWKVGSRSSKAGHWAVASVYHSGPRINLFLGPRWRRANGRSLARRASEGCLARESQYAHSSGHR